ncbi:MAG: hypothetical protein ACE5DT_04700 [Nitrosopumilus sp.]
MQLKLLFLCFAFLTIFISFENASATPEPILITISPSMEHVIFDGKWTNWSEWKQSSHNPYIFDDGEVTIHLRTAHLGDYIYVFVDPVDDLTLDEKMDEATVCLDGKNNKNEIHDTDDFCFSVSLGSNEGSVFQGSTIDESTISIQKIPNPDNFIAISAVSDENDRYVKTPHPSYEFKIPIELLERSDNYGFYLSVYDASLDKFYSWPENSTRNNSSDIPPPSEWGDIVSPDKSLPELNIPILIFTVLIFTIILIQSKARIHIFRW